MITTWYQHDDWDEVVMEQPAEGRHVRLVADPDGTALSLVQEQGYPCYDGITLSPEEWRVVCDFVQGLLPPVVVHDVLPWSEASAEEPTADAEG